MKNGNYWIFDKHRYGNEVVRVTDGMFYLRKQKGKQNENYDVQR